MRDNPAYREIPLAIGGSEERRGVIATCNYPARKFGVRSAMSTAKAKRLCPNLTVISGNMEKYRQVSQQVMEIFRQYTDLIEPLSLDEAYLDVTDCTLHQGSATRIAEEIRYKVASQIGITISAGVAPNKFLAKVASDWQKPDGLFVIPPDKVDAFVQPLPVRLISGVGEKTAQRLKGMGVETCLQLQVFTRAQLIDRLGRFGDALYDRCRGIDEREVKTSRERKSVSVEHTYPDDLPDLQRCILQLPILLQQLELRYKKLKQPYQITGLVVKVKFHDFSQTTAERAGAALSLECYQQLLTEAWSRSERPVRLLGVGYRLGEPVVASNYKQLSLF